jgi:hypothetical protein
VNFKRNYFRRDNVQNLSHFQDCRLPLN